MNPLLRPSAIALAMISLAIGWGIRGNFGHEFGAMVPGALCAIAVCLFSGREDWRERVPYFAMFGALGWAFGGSIAYMPTISYTHSGHLPTQLYGFFAVFLVGFLWAGMGGAGTAWAAVESPENLTAVFRPLCWVLGFWTVQYFWPENLFTREFRQRSPFYWLDSEWIEASLALAALCAFDLWDRRFEKAGLMALLGAAGAGIGYAVRPLVRPLAEGLVRYQGDTQAFDRNNLMTNWPQVFFDLGPHLGWILGLAAGLGLYFWRYGKWRSGASMLLHITLGSYAVFLAIPVLLGIRLTPPRGDSWANCLGAFLGLMLYLRRRRQTAVIAAALVAGFTGGLGFMLAQFLKLLAWMPGNPLLTADPAVRQAWTHWRSANWHSILAEQGVGLFYGLAIVLAMALVASRTKPQPAPVAEQHPRRWTQAFSVFFVLNLLVFVNLVKNVQDWTRSHAVPERMKAPLAGAVELSAAGWFNLMFGLLALTTVALLTLHLRRRLAVVPSTWLGKGQLFYLAFLWIMVIGNFERALVAFAQERLATEGAILVNALIATFLLLAFARGKESVAIRPAPFGAAIRRVALAGTAAMILFGLSFATLVHWVYGGRHDGWGGRNIRFGPEADWRVRPILKNATHR